MEFLRVSENGRFLVTETGAPFFWMGDTAWELFHRLNRQEAEHYLSNRATKGFNVVQAVVLAERDGLHTPNTYGHTPLYDDDPTRLNADYFAYVDEIIRLAETYSIYIGLLPTWGDKVDLVGGTGPVIFNEQNAHAYGELLGRRYRQQPNIVWILGGDRFAEGFEAVWRAMAQGIQAGAGARALITYHPRGAGQSSTSLHGEPWLAFNMIQSGHGDYNIANWKWIAEDYALTPVKPTLDSEPNYEYHPVAFDAKLRKGRFSDYDVRKAAYRAVLAGACGHTYGHHSIWQMYDERYEGVVAPGVTWKEALDFPGASQMTHLCRLIASRPYLSRVPDDSLVGATEADPALHASASRDTDGSYALVYIPTAGQPFTVHLQALSGSGFKAWWYDPGSGETTPPSFLPREDKHTFVSPANGTDWVLVIDDAERDFPPPGHSILD